MGTNYYVEAGPPCPCCKRPYEQLHIGKSSGGWKFLFAPYPEQGLTSWAAWKKYLGGKAIKDEYGDPVGLEELSRLIEIKQEKGWCSETAPDEAWGPSTRDRERKDPDGFRFSDTADFS